MNKLNLFLLVVFILIHTVSFSFWKENDRKRKNNKKISIDGILEVLKELSLTFNYQNYIFFSSKNYLFELTKYHDSKLWGIKLIFDLSKNKNEKEIIKLLNRLDIEYIVVDDQCGSIMGIIVNFRNDIKKIESFIITLLKNHYQITEDNFLILKKELEFRTSD